MSKFKVMANSLYLRQEPKPTGKIIGVLQKDEEVNLISVSGDGYWYNIERNDNQVGWASHKYLAGLDNDDDIQNEEFPWMPFSIREIGIKEYSGAADNPRIAEYLSSTSLGFPANKNDETAWCSSFVNWCIEKAGLAGTDSAWARSWEHWGQEIKKPRRGCIVVFKRPYSSSDKKMSCGYVAFYISGANTKIYVLGGNQHDEVCYSEFSTKDVLSYRIP